MVSRVKNWFVKILRWSEKYTGTDMIYIANGGFWIGLQKITLTFVALGLSVAYANLLSIDIYGLYKFVISLAGIIVAFSLSGMGPAITRAVSRGEGGALRIGTITFLKWSIIMFVLSLGGAIYYLAQGNIDLAIALLILSLFVPPMESFKFYNSFLIGKKDFQRSTLYEILKSVLSAIILISTMIAFKNAIILVLAYFVTNSIIIVSLYMRVKHIYRLSISEAPQLVSYSKHLSAMNIISTISKNLDQILIFHFLGAAQVAIYSFALSAPYRLRDAGTMLPTMALPKLSERSIEELKATLPRKVLLLFIPTFVLTALYIVTAPLLFHLVFPQYLDSIQYSQIISLVLLLLPFSLFPQVLIAHMKKKQLYVLNTVIPGIRIALLVILLPFFGIWGAIIAVLISQSIGAITNTFFFFTLKS